MEHTALFRWIGARLHVGGTGPDSSLRLLSRPTGIRDSVGGGCHADWVSDRQCPDWALYRPSPLVLVSRGGRLPVFLCLVANTFSTSDPAVIATGTHYPGGTGVDTASGSNGDALPPRPAFAQPGALGRSSLGLGNQRLLLGRRRRHGDPDRSGGGIQSVAGIGGWRLSGVDGGEISR